ncbi:LysR family transcriptional regulator [Actinoplanes regularis]|uniref:Transcriptional regulator, LysR family n=1 Tax=Actinoplanes regularis TaxID=52697 RepID=A0A239EQF1_9ACTN|nr:LysR family transcriptional regulator [Actinoplanes regularis]GIE89836.1 LysR family transcriptional regulator [Actinoplanes regularis]SNS46865.1 transcriptional regulator, LysR family [Actinoplanes regularis]
MELRDIEIFLTLAEELHFGRTAERLRVSQARVSQSIKQQERRIGGALFERTSRNVRLTPLGRQLRDDLHPHFHGLHEGLQRARLAAQGSTRALRLGMVSWNYPDLQPFFDALVVRTGCAVQVRSVEFGDPFGPLRAGDIDAAILWLPVREPDLSVGPVVYTEPIVLATSATHPLTRQETVSYEDLADCVVMGGCSPDYWREALVPSHTPSGRLIPIGPSVTNGQQMLPILASGEAVSPAHAHGRYYANAPGITYLPIRDAPPARFALIWRTAAETQLIRTFAELVAEAGPLALYGAPESPPSHP